MHGCRGFLIGCILGLTGCASGPDRIDEAEQPAPRPATARAQPEPRPIPELRIGEPLSTANPRPTESPAILPTRATDPTPVQTPKPEPSKAPLSLPSVKTTDVSSTSANGQLVSLYREAAERYAGIESYIVRFRRREQLNGKDKPEEIMLVKFRKQPWSIYFKWLGNEGKGRQVVYVKGQYEDKIHTLLAAGDVPLMPAGKRFSVSPDNPLVRANSRHAIQEAGFGVLIERFGRMINANERGDFRYGTAKYLGSIRRPEMDHPGIAVEQLLAPGNDPLLPRGGKRLWVFDPVSKFPMLIVTHDDAGHEVEYYSYDLLMCPVRLDDDDFNPQKIWPAKN